MEETVKKDNRKRKRFMRWFRYNIFPIMLLIGLVFISSWLYDAVGNRRYLQRVYVDLQDSYEVVAFGDSLIEGLGATDSYGFISRIEDRLDIELYNAGRRRMQTTEAVGLVSSQVIEFEPDLVIVSIGGNDALRRIPIETIRANFFAIINQITETGAQIILLGINPGEISRSYSYEEIYQDIETMYPKNVTVVHDFYDQIAYQPKYLFDPIHPNDEGHEVLAQYLEPIVFTKLEEIRSSE